jgi:hypothetical protein
MGGEDLYPPVGSGPNKNSFGWKRNFSREEEISHEVLIGVLR